VLIPSSMHDMIPWLLTFLEYIHVHFYSRLYGFLSEVVKCKTQKNKLSLCCVESGSGAEPGK
jgi:hypothetical protein